MRIKIVNSNTENVNSSVSQVCYLTYFLQPIHLLLKFEKIIVPVSVYK